MRGIAARAGTSTTLAQTERLSRGDFSIPSAVIRNGKSSFAILRVDPNPCLGVAGARYCGLGSDRKMTLRWPTESQIGERDGNWEMR